jgi:DNA-binding NarL/FixJ family response regulator
MRENVDSCSVEDAEEPLDTMHLSAREWQILSLIVILAEPSKEIAYDLGIKPASVKSYFFRICQQLGFKNRADVARWWTTYSERSSDLVRRHML